MENLLWRIPPGEIMEVVESGPTTDVDLSDPRNPYYKTVCFVCKEVARFGTEHKIHYRGVVCHSCKAFFSRCCAEQKEPKYRCLENNACLINPANRRRCQKCRFDKCIQAGMTVDCVLTKHEKDIRFKKSALKRHKVGITGALWTGQEEKGSQDKKLLKLTCHPFVHRLKVRKKFPVQAAVDLKWVHRILNKFVTITKEDVIQGIQGLSSLFRAFAYKFRFFTNLDPKIQDEILCLNTPLFIQLFFGLLSSCQTGVEQFTIIQQLLEVRVQRLEVNVVKLDMAYFICLAGLFIKGVNISSYFFKADMLRGIQLDNHLQDLSLIAYLIICDPTPSTRARRILISERQLSVSLFEKYVTTRSPTFKAIDLLLTLKGLAMFFGDDKQVARQLSTSQLASKSADDFEYNKVEEDWLQENFTQLEDHYRSVGIKELLVDEFMLFGAGVTVSKGFISKSIEIFKERLKQLMINHTGLAQLSRCVHFNLMSDNIPLALALVVLKMEFSPTALDQLQNALGELNEQKWEREIIPYLKNIPSRKCTLSVLAAEKSEVIDLNLLDIFYENLRSCRILVSNLWIFKFCLFLVVTRPPKYSKEPITEIQELHSRFHILFRKRIKWMLAHNRPESECPIRNNEDYCMFMNSLEMLETLAKSLSQLFNKRSNV